MYYFKIGAIQSIPDYQNSVCSEGLTNQWNRNNQKQLGDTDSLRIEAQTRLKLKKRPTTIVAPSEKEVVDEIRNIIEDQFGPCITSLMSSIESSENRLQERQILEQIQNDWSDVAKVADHFLFYFFPSMTILTCFIIFLNSPHVFSQW